MYGNRPIKLLIKTITNKLINIIVLPENALGPKRVLNSMWSLFVASLNKIRFLLGTNQKDGVKITIKTNTETQFKETPKIADGSNTEKRLVIIFSSY